MPEDHSDRSDLSQEETLAQTRALLKEAAARFSKEARRKERLDADARIRASRAAHRAAKRLPAKTANKRARQRTYKLKLATARKAEREARQAEAAILLADLPMTPTVIDAQALAAEEVAFRQWIEARGRQQGAARGIEKRAPGEIMATREALLRARAEGMSPSWQTFAERFGIATGRVWSREQARRRVAFLTGLEAAGGPWQASPAGVRVFEAPPEVCGS